ncbi:MAG: hypothetical protein AAGK97_11605, partial [Bacteroidota bacterium]
MAFKDYDEYTKEWKEIDKLESEGLPKSALEKIETLYERAKKDKNHPQIVKCIIYLNKNQMQLEEDALVKSIQRIEDVIPLTEEPAKSILHSMLGELYNNYLQQNIWNLRNRTEFQAFDDNDILTWPAGKFIEKSKIHYKQSLVWTDLKGQAIDDFKALLSNYKTFNTRSTNPSLYNLLVSRAIQAFASDQNYLDQPKYQFKIKDKEALGDIDVFLNHSFESEQKDAGKLLALHLYQDLLNYHKEQKNEEGLILTNLGRLQFVYAHIIHENKEALYEAALKSFLKKNRNKETSAEIAYVLARYYEMNGNKYQPGVSEDYKAHYKKAIEIAEEAIAKHPSSYGAKQCQNLIKNIKYPNLSFTIEDVQIPNKPFRSLVQFKNVQKVFIRIIQLSEAQRKTFEDYRNFERRYNYLKGLDTFKSFEQVLPDEGDFQSHSVEIAFPELPIGYYAIIMDDHPGLDKKGVASVINTAHVTNLAFWQNGSMTDDKLIIVNRNTGHPIEDVKVEFFVQEYN